MTRASLLITVYVLALGCACIPCPNIPVARPSSTPVIQGDRESDEYDVYATLIDEMYVNEQVKLIVIVDHTEAGLGEDLDQTLQHITKNISGIQQETLDDFRTQNAQSYPLSDDFNLQVPHTLISQQEMEEIFRTGDGWDEFYQKYPDSQGTMTLSRVGFNQERDQALVYVGNQSHWLAGAGYYVLLARQDGAWVIQDSEMVWIS
jgi:hypothetical protein